MATQTYTFTAVVNKQRGNYLAFSPEAVVDGEGLTIEDALANLKLATQKQLEEESLYGFTKPWLITNGIEVAPDNGSKQKYRFDVIVHQEDGDYVVFCPEVGTSDSGETLEYALRMLIAGTKLYLECGPLPDYSKPFLVEFSVEVRRQELALA